MDRERRYVVILEEDEEDGGYVATAPAFPGVADQGETEEEALENFREALTFTIECMVKDGERLPKSDAGPGHRRLVREVELAV